MGVEPVKTRLILALFVLASLIAACSAERFVCPDGRTVASAGECAEPAAPRETADDAPVAPAEEEEEETESQFGMDPALKALLAKSDEKVRSMKFVYAPIEIVSGQTTLSPGHTYKVRGDLVKVEVWGASMNKPTTNIDTVYLNRATEAARGFCMGDGKIGCSIKGDPRPTTYGEWDIDYPLDWIDRIPSDAVLKGSRSLQNRDVNLVRFEKDGQYYEALIDGYGVPLRINIYSEPDYSGLIGGVEYQAYQENLVTVADVTAPQ